MINFRLDFGNIRNVPVHFQEAPGLPLQPDLLPEWPAGREAELLLRVQAQEGFQARRPPQAFWLLQCRGGVSLLQVRSSITISAGKLILHVLHGHRLI